MAEEQQVEKPAETPAPQISADDINRVIEAKVSEKLGDVSQAIKESESKAYDRIKNQLVQSLDPKKADEKNPLHTAFVQDPDRLFASIIQTASDTVLQQVNDRESLQREMSSAIADIYNEYPDLQKTPNEVYAEYHKQGRADANKPVSERLKIAAETVAKRVGVKKRSETEKENAVNAASMTPMGIYQKEVEKKNEDTAKSFIQQRQKWAAFARNPQGKRPA